MARIPSSRKDYVKALIKAWKPSWMYSRTHIRTMSLASLRQVYRELLAINFLKLGGEHGGNDKRG